MKLLETIKCKDGKLFNLKYHQARCEVALMKYFPKAAKIRLDKRIQIPVAYLNGLYRCRIEYSDVIEKIEFAPHEYKKVSSLKLVEDNNIEYQNKYTNRTRLQHLFDQRGNCDDILIVQNNCITDSFTANPIFFDGEKWWTPDTPLLPGTQRARLIEENRIAVCRITVDDLNKYKKIGLVNALQDMNDMPVIDIDQLKK